MIISTILRSKTFELWAAYFSFTIIIFPNSVITISSNAKIPSNSMTGNFSRSDEPFNSKPKNFVLLISQNFSILRRYRTNQESLALVISGRLISTCDSCAFGCDFGSGFSGVFSLLLYFPCHFSFFKCLRSIASPLCFEIVCIFSFL